MLRSLVLALVLLNGVYWAWSQGLLRDIGFAPEQQGEPQRIAKQIKPQALEILRPEQFKQFEEQAKAAADPKECLQAGPLDAEQSAAVRKVLESAWPAGSWEMQTLNLPQRWIVYMGKYDTTDLLLKKRAEIAAMNLRMEAINNPALEPGLSLGGFATEAQADEALQQLSKRGIHTARVVQELQGGVAFELRMPAVNETLKAKLGDVKSALAGKPVTPCAQLASSPG
jgi:hypothetical protein